MVAPSFAPDSTRCTPTGAESALPTARGFRHLQHTYASVSIFSSRAFHSIKSTPHIVARSDVFLTVPSSYF